MHTLKNARFLWRQLADRGFDGNLTGLRLDPELDSASDEPYEQDPLHLFSPDVGLGDMPRLFAIVDFTGAKRGELFKEACTLSGLPLGGSGNLQKILQLGHRKPSGFGSRYHSAFETIVNRKRADLDLNPLPAGVLFGSKFTGDGAIAEFLRILSSAWSVDGPAKRPSKFILTRDRAIFADKIREALAEGEDKPMLVNIYGMHLWAGLSACSDWIVEELGQDRRKPFVVPLRRMRGPDDAEILNISEILGHLRAMVCTRGDNDREAAVPISDRDGLFDVVNEIRNGLAEHPRVIVFDGHYVGDTSLLEQRIADDYVDSLIMRLLEPPLGGDPSIDLARFRSNRIVVTSNEKFDEEWRRQLPRVPGSAGPRAVALPSPDADQWREALSHQQFSEPAETTRLAWTDAFLENRTDAILIADAALRAIRELAPDNPDDYVGKFETLLHGADERVPLADVAVQAFLALLSDLKPVWREIADVVSLTPDGLRRSTLRRLARNAATSNGVLPELVQSEASGELGGEIDRLARSALPILGSVRNDAFEGFDVIDAPRDAARHQEYGEPVVDEIDERTFSRSLDFLYSDLKVVARTAAAQRLGIRQFHSVQRLLAEEALTQQTISLRHVDNTTLQSIRPWRRMLSAIFHGLQSVPLEIDAKGVVEIGTESFGVRSLTSYPTASQFWVYLYAFCYRRMMERPPAWNLSRLYGLDELKAEILLAFDKPWRLWPAIIRPAEIQPREHGVVEAVACLGAGGKDIATEHRSSLAQSYLAVGSITKAKNVLFPHGRRKQGGADGYNAHTDHSVFKRAFEIDLLKGDAIDLAAVELRVARVIAGTDPEAAEGARLKRRIDEEIEHAAQEFMKRLDEPDTTYGNAAGLYSFKAVAETVSRLRELKVGAAALAELHDIYSRIGEYGATRADLAIAAEDVGDIPEGGLAGELELEMMRDFALAGDVPLFERIDYEFCKSLAQLALAEQFRLQAFMEDPLGAEYFASGNSARQFIRVALKLEGRRAKRLKLPGPVFGVFARQARRTADTLTRNLFRYPRERGAQIVIEATMLRLLSTPENYKSRLRVADAFLADADALLIGLGRRVRARMRLKLERAKLNRALVEGSERNSEERRKRLLQWRYDVEMLGSLAKETDMPIWLTLAKLQRKSLDRFTKARGE